MVQVAEKVVLNEVMAEEGLVGSLLIAPEHFGTFAPDINADWFTDPLLRYMYEACLRIHLAGNMISTTSIKAALPEYIGEVSRNHLYARLVAGGMPASYITGMMETLRDRWRRRQIIEAAQIAIIEAETIGSDPVEIAVNATSQIDTVSAAGATRKGVTIAQALAGLMEQLDAPAALRGATTGLHALDNKLNGFKAGQLYVFAGRPGMGKSAVMCSLLRRTAQAGHGVGIFSLEMTAEEVTARMIADTLDSTRAPTFEAISKGLLSEEQKGEVFFAAENLATIPLHIDASPRLTWGEISARARRLKAQYDAAGTPLAVICIDHMGLVAPSDRYMGNKVAEAGEISNAARVLAKDLNCCVLLLCQLSREVEKRDDKRPTLSDLRWSGEIEQDAHVVAFIYREAYYLAQDPNADSYAVNEAKNRMDILVRKNRNGETTDLQLWCSIGHSCLRDE